MNPQIRVLSAGAPKGGLRAVADAFEATGSGRVTLRFATAPAIQAEIAAGGADADVLVLPPGGMNEAATRGSIEQSSRVMLGRIGAGVAVRADAPLPDLSSVASLRRELELADTIVFNNASTGLYIESLLERMGLAARLAASIRRQDSGAGVMNHLREHTGRDIGFGAITEILAFRDRGVRLAGALPPEIQNYTRYEAAVLSTAAAPAAARALVAFLDGAPARRLLMEHGIEPARPVEVESGRRPVSG